MLGWARREPKAEEAGLGRLGRTRRPLGDPDCHDPGQGPGLGAAAFIASWGGCARWGGCGAADVRDFFFKIRVAGPEAASLLSSVSEFASNLLSCVLRVSQWSWVKTALFTLFFPVPK